MSSGLLQQLGSKGIQNIHLDLKPEASFWKRGYKRYAAFAEESINQYIPNLAWGSQRQQDITRNGDLLDALYFVAEVQPCQLATPGPDTVNFCNVLGHVMLSSLTAYIGNNEIDDTEADVLEILHEVDSDLNKNTDELVLRSTSQAQLINWTNNGNTWDSNGNPIVGVYVKLPLWFNAAPSQALPLISLQFHNLSIKFQLASLNNLLQFSNPANTTLSSTWTGLINQGYFMGCFIFLDALERKLFAANAHEYLIKNYQVSDYNVKSSGLNKLQAQVIMSQPVLWFAVFIRKQSNINANDYFNWERTAGLADDTITTMTISFNGAQRETPRGPLFYRVIQAERFFNRTPLRPLYVYSFARHPLAWFPSGTVNLSRIDTTTFEFVFPTVDANGVAYGQAEIKIVAFNFNVLRISGGLASRKFAN